MKPRAPYHRVTTAHREPGGLRRLDLMVRRIGAWAGGRDPSRIRILVREASQGNVSFPLSLLGYDVTIFEPNVAVVQNATVSANDLGLSLGFASSINDLSAHRYDIVVIDRSISSDDAGMLNDIRASLADSGIAVCSVHGLNAKHLNRQGWRCRDADRIGASFNVLWPLLNRLGVKRGSRMFHLLDAFDGFCATHGILAFGRSWVAELEPRDAEKPFVMHAVPTFGAGGAERLVYEIVARLPAEGYEAKALPITGGGELETLFRDHGTPFVPISRRRKFGLGTLFALRRVFRLQRPDIVHTHLFIGDTMGRLAAFFAGVPVIVSTEHNVNQSYRWSHRLVNRILAAVTDAHVSVSDEVRRVMVGKDHVRASKVRTILNGVDLDLVVQRSARPFRDVPRLIIVGRMYAQKDHATLFKALALVKRPWRLRVVGSGPLEKRLHQLAERLQISSRIEWLGYRDDVPELLAESDLFCFPSRYEGLGLAAVEAAAAGVPIVASDIAPLREILDVDDVRYVAAGDVPAWAHAIADILSDPVESVLRANRAVPRIRARASIDLMVRQYAKLYRELLDKG
jgi:glycosyltransferase involved in cell wall biosynthesis